MNAAALDRATRKEGDECPKCKAKALWYRNLGSIGRKVCEACGWIDFEGKH